MMGAKNMPSLITEHMRGNCFVTTSSPMPCCGSRGMSAMQGTSTKGNTMRSVKHAMGPSFGSLCFGSAILTLVQLIRNAMESCAPN